jgi:O-Antigen ligase
VSLTALLFITGFFACLVLAFAKHPVFGLYAYLLTFYSSPTTAWWGHSIPDLRWSLLSAVVTLVAALARAGDVSRDPWYRQPAVRALMLFAAWLWIQSAWALSFDDHLFLATLFTKYVLMFAVLYTVLDTPERIQNFLAANVVGCFYWGYLAWQSKGSGRLEAIGTADVTGSAFASMHVSTMLAVAGFMFLGCSGWKKWLPVAATPFMLNAIVQMQTRGAFVGLIAAAPVALLVAPDRKRILVIICLALGCVLFLRVGNEAFWERMATIRPAENQQMEASAASRFEIIKGNWRMFRDHPMGAGHRGNDLLSPKYLPETLLTDKQGVQLRSAHNSLAAILVDHGLIGILLMLVFHARLARLILRLRKKTTEISAETHALVGGLATAIMIYWVNAQFANMTKAEVVIWIAAVAASLESISSVREEQTVARTRAWPAGQFQARTP